MGYKKTIMFLLVLGIVCLGSVYAPDFFDSGDTATQHTMTVSQTQSWYISEINDTELFYDIDSVSYDGKDFKVNLKAVDEIKDIEKDAKSLPDGSIAVKDKEDKEIEDKEKEPKELVVIADSETVSTIEELKTKLTIKAKDYGTGEDKETISFFDDFNRTTGKHNYSYDVLADYSYTAMVDTYDDNGKMNGSVLKEISVARDEVILKLGDNSIYITATLGTDLKVLQTTTNDTGYVSSIDVSEGRLFAGQTNSSYDLTSDMVLWMSMDNFNISNDKIWDYSGENNHGTTYPTATLGQDKWVTGQIGNALSFDGSNDYINCGNDLSHNFSSESFTLEAWIKPDETSTERYIIEKRKEGSFVGISIDSSDNPRFYFRDEASVSNAIKSSNTYIDTFVHIVATRDYGNAFHLYVDGNEVGSGVADTYGLMFGEEELFIGSADGVSNFANGIIDDVRIYGRALTGAEVNDSYWRGSDGLETNVSATGLVLWSKLDESNYDNTAFDSSSESNDGVLHNYPPMVTAGNISNAIYFDGFDDYILCDDDIELGTADFTVSVWTKKGKHTSIYDSIISQGQTGADEWLFYFYSSTSIRFYADSGAINTESQTIPDINDWRMFTFIRDGDYGYLYNNVTLIKTISGIDDVNLNTAYKVSIGASLEGMQRRYNGTIDDVRIYSRALSIDELTARYQMTADNYDTTTEAISHSAITYDTVSNTNDTLIVNVPEVRYDLTFAPTYIKDTNLTVIDIETGVIDRYGWGNDAYGRQLTTDPDYLISGTKGITLLWNSSYSVNSYASWDWNEFEDKVPDDISRFDRMDVEMCVDNHSTFGTYRVRLGSAGWTNYGQWDYSLTELCDTYTYDLDNPDVSYGFDKTVHIGWAWITLESTDGTDYIHNMTIDTITLYNSADTHILFTTTDSDWYDQETVTVTENYLNEANMTRIRITNPYAMNKYDLLNFNLSSYWTGNPNDIQNVWYDSYTGATDNSTLKDTSDYSQYIDTCKSGNISGLVSCWNFNEGYGTTANDRGNYSVNGNDGTLTNMNTGIDNGTSGWTQSGKFGGGVMIDYTLQSINCGNDSTLKPLDQITFMGWFKPTRHEDYQRYMSMHADNDYYGYGIKELAGNKFNLVMDINGVSNTATSNSDSVLNQWVHLVGSYNGTGLNLYVDGILQDDTEAATGDIRYNEFDFVIGNRHTSSRAMHGTIDEVKIYNRALSQSEITAEYNLKKDYFNAMPNEEGGITASSNWDIFLTNGTTDIPPTIEIQQPPATNTTINWFNISAYDINEISSCWFSLGATANYTLTNSSGNWNYQNSSLIESDYTVTFYCNDSLGNEKSTDRYFTYDLTDPFVKIHEPTNISYATTTLDLNYTSTDINRDTTWYEYNGTNTTLSGNTTFTALDDQQSNLTLWANDSTGNTNSTTVFFKVDTTEPLLTINTPTEDQNISDTDRIDFNVSYVELYPDTCILVFDSINYSMTIDTTNKECTVTLGNIADGTYPYYVWMNDTVGNDNQTSGSATITYTASWYERISGSGGGVPVSITQPIIIPDNLTAIEPTEISRIIAPATVGTGSFTIYNLDTISKRYTVSFDCSGYNDTLCNYIYLHDPILSGLTNALSIDIAGLSNKSIDYQLSIPKDINQTVFNADILITPDSDESLTLPVTYTTITKITILNFIQDYKYLLAGFTIFILVLLYFSNNDKRGRFD